MENGVEALKIAFGMIIFVFAISIAISCFTQAAQAMQRIWEVQQEDESYVTDEFGNYLNYVNFHGGTREVGTETVVPTMYRAYKENFAVYFFNSDKTTPFELYKNSRNEIVNYIDLIAEEAYTNETAAIEHLNKLLDEEGLYERLSGKTFVEYLGEYYQEDVSGVTDTAEVNKNKKRVIVYVLK